MKALFSEHWGNIPEQTQRQIKKATVAAAVAFGTVLIAPLINPLHPSHRHAPHKRGDDAPGSRTHGASHQGRQHGGPHRQGGGHGDRGRE